MRHLLSTSEAFPSDVLIIGGGVIGLCTAFYCAERGASVTLLERGLIPAGSSYGNAGLIVPSHCQPLANPSALLEGLRFLFDPHGPFTIKFRPEPALFEWLFRFLRYCNKRHLISSVNSLSRFIQESCRLHEQMAKDGGAAYEYSRTGLLYLYSSEDAFSDGKKDARFLKRFRIESRVLSTPELRAEEPSVAENIAGAVQYPADCRLNPAAFVTWLAQQVRIRGVRIWEETEVIGIRANGRKLSSIITTKGNFSGDDIVFAAGAWTSKLLRSAGIRFPLQAAKGYSVSFKKTGAMPVSPLLLEEPRIAVSTFKNMFRIAGVLELAGLDPAIDPRRIDRMLFQVKRFVPGLHHLELLEIWQGFRPCTPDGLPVIGKTKQFYNLWIATGHATKGISLGPITGKMLADLLQGHSAGPWVKKFSPARFNL